MKALNRETTIAKRLPEALNDPSSAERPDSGGAFSPFLSFFSVTQCLRGRFVLDPERSAAKNLLPLKHRQPLLQKCRRPFLLIFRRAGHAKQNRLQIKPLAQSHLHAF